MMAIIEPHDLIFAFLIMFAITSIQLEYASTLLQAIYSALGLVLGCSSFRFCEVSSLIITQALLFLSIKSSP